MAHDGRGSLAIPSRRRALRSRVAKMLGEDEALLEEIALDMEPEDGCLCIYDIDDDIQVTAFTPFGIECLKELLAEVKAQKPPRSTE
jgi:hypothetical protein